MEALIQRLSEVPTEVETRRLMSIFKDCYLSWNELLVAHRIPSSVLMTFQPVGASWLDSDVLDAARA
jgi:hypothetical protein